jgi:hypothetical protein
LGTVRTSEQVAASIRAYTRGASADPVWFPAALTNDHISFCGTPERRHFERGLAEAVETATPEGLRTLSEWVCIYASPHLEATLLEHHSALAEKARARMAKLVQRSRECSAKRNNR